MRNIKNLKPLSTEEARRIGKIGGLKSAESRNRKKTLKEQMELILSLPIKDSKTREYLVSMGIDSDLLDNYMCISVSLLNEALKGNVRAFDIIRDILGEKSSEVIEIREVPIIEIKRPDK